LRLSRRRLERLHHRSGERVDVLLDLRRRPVVDGAQGIEKLAPGERVVRPLLQLGKLLVHQPGKQLAFPFRHGSLPLLTRFERVVPGQRR
jgi:hypothetical protein